MAGVPGLLGITTGVSKEQWCNAPREAEKMRNEKIGKLKAAGEESDEES